MKKHAMHLEMGCAWSWAKGGLGDEWASHDLTRVTCRRCLRSAAFRLALEQAERVAADSGHPERLDALATVRRRAEATVGPWGLTGPLGPEAAKPER